jgi:Protein of unknown function (DUF1326)
MRRLRIASVRSTLAGKSESESDSRCGRHTARRRNPRHGAPARVGGLLGGWAAALLLTAVFAPAGAALPVHPGVAPGERIAGDYLEARTADVYTGPCFANSEMSLVGKQAVLAWRVRQGTWNGVPLAGLSVVAAVRAAATLGDPFGGPLDARALVVVDERATAAQRQALVAFAQAAAGDLLSRVVGIESAPIALDLGSASAAAPPVHAAVGPGAGTAGAAVAPGHEAAGKAAMAGVTAADLDDRQQPRRSGHHPELTGISGEAHLRAGDWVALTTRALSPKDHLCGNEEIYYQPLATAGAQVTAVPAVTVDYDFRGPGLGMTWSSPGKRSAFVGTFSR